MRRLVHACLFDGKKEDHTARQAALCTELTAGVQQNLTEKDTILRQLFETHDESVIMASYLRSCLNTDRMDTLYEEACCGHFGFVTKIYRTRGLNPRDFQILGPLMYGRKILDFQRVGAVIACLQSCKRFGRRDEGEGIIFQVIAS